MKKQHLHLAWKVSTDQFCVLDLDANFTPYSQVKNAFALQHTHITFPGGEDHITIHWLDEILGKPSLVITQRVNSAQDFFKILIAADAARRSRKFSTISLFCPYFPAARQDRVCNSGEALTVKVFADLINCARFDEVIIASPHSEVVTALLDNVTVIDLDLNFAIPVANTVLNGGNILNVVCPDAGAGKRVMKIASLIQKGLPKIVINFVRCEKVRDTVSGSLTAFFVAEEDLGGHPSIIFDDIVAYGGTFLGLHDALKLKNSGDISIFTCHTDCIAGVNNLASSFKQVFMTNSKIDVDLVEYSNLTIFDILI